MKAQHTALLFAAVLVFGLAARAQTPGVKHFDKDGLAFDYPEGWTIEDQSNGDAQQLNLGRADSDAQIRLFVHRGRVDTPEKMAKAKAAFIDPYIASTNNIFTQMGAKAERSPATTQIGGAPAEGVRLRASLDGEPGEAAIYWVAVGSRVAVLTFFGPDAALKKATPAWDAVRNSLHVELPQPKASPAPKPTPKP